MNNYTSEKSIIDLGKFQIITETRYYESWSHKNITLEYEGKYMGGTSNKTLTKNPAKFAKQFLTSRIKRRKKRIEGLKADLESNQKDLKVYEECMEKLKNA